MFSGVTFDNQQYFKQFESMLIKLSGNAFIIQFGSPANQHIKLMNDRR